MKVKNVLFAAFTASIFFIACGNNASESATKQVEKAVETVKTDAIVKAEFTCPMKCENGKIFDVAGKCPTCKMDLVAVTHKDGDGHSK
jgi:Heavy metal binding domain